jgi:hypothetical protein
LFSHTYHLRFDLDLNARLECLTLAVGNAKSHPVSAGGRHETALAYLTDLEEKLEVAQVQLEIYHMLLPRLNESGAVGERIRLLQKTLLNISDVSSKVVLIFTIPMTMLYSCTPNMRSLSTWLKSSYLSSMYLTIEMTGSLAQFGTAFSKRVSQSTFM